MSHQRLTRSGAIALALAALAVPNAAAQQQDLLSPDARDAAHVQPPQNLRSPDVADAAAGRGTSSAPDVTVVKVPQPAPSAGGIDLGDAGIGAGAALGLTVVGLGGMFAVARRRQPGAVRRQTATTR